MKDKRWRLILLLTMTALAITACAGRIIRGSGDVISETRRVSGFEKIVLHGSGDVIVTQGEGETLSIETDDNVMEYVEAEVRGSTLELGFKEGARLIDPTRLIFHVGVDVLTDLDISGSGDVEADRIESERLQLEVSGSGDIQISDLKADAVHANISGSGEIDLSGDAPSQEVRISGSGKYLAGDLCGETVDVVVSGSGDARVCATETLDVDVSGSGNIGYYGRPTVNMSGSGSGRVNSLGE